MKKRLTIKRVGTLIPAFCLVGFLFIVSIIIWLTTAGFPQFVIDKVEDAALEKGVPLKIEKLRLSFSQGTGVVAEGIQIYAVEGDDTPVLALDSVSVHMETLPLFVGNFKLKAAQLKGGKITLPVSDGEGKETLDTTAINITASIHDNYVTLTDTDCKLQGVPLHIKGGFSIADITSGDLAEEENEKLVIPAMIQGSQNIIDKVYHRIEEQHWVGEEFPEVYLDFTADEKFSMYVQATVPKYDIAQFSFRDAKLNLEYANEKVIVHHLDFHTVEPITKVYFQGGFELETKKLTFDIRSNAALLDMITALSEGEMNSMLGKFRHAPEKAPDIKLTGAVQFGEELQLIAAELLGDIHQEELFVGDSLIDAINLSFYYRNGIFNINQLALNFQDGSINLKADTCGGHGNAEMDADVSIPRIIALINEFTNEPITIPRELSFGNKLKLKAKASLVVPEFLPGEQQSAFFAPHLTDLHASIDLEELKFQQNNLSNLHFDITCKGNQDTSKSLLESIQEFNLKLQTPSVQLVLTEQGHVKLKNSELTFNATDFVRVPETGNISLNNVELQLDAEEAQYSQISTGKLTAHTEARHLSYKEEEFKTESLNFILNALSPQYADTACEQIKIAARCTADTEKPIRECLTDAIVQLTAKGISINSVKQGNLTALFNLPRDAQGNIYLAFKPTTEAYMRPAYIRATTIPTEDGALQLQNFNAVFSPSDLAQLGLALKLQTGLFELPKEVSISGNLTLDYNKWALRSFDCTLNIPELVRTPETIAVFRGKKVPVKLNACIAVNAANNDGFDYVADVNLSHQTGALTTTLKGNTAVGVQATGKCTIRPDALDMLIDDEDTHSMLRDFKFNSQSQSTISNLAVDVLYHDGLQIKADFDWTADNIQYQLNAVLDTKNGREEANKDLRQLPYASIRNAKSHVNVDWQSYDDERKDVASIVLTNTKIEYDNRPWLKTQNFTTLGLSKQGPGATKHQFSTLSGDKVIIDVEDYFVKLVNVKGSVYPGYSLGMFYPDLREYFSIVLTPYPATISTESCKFPISKTSKVPMEGIIRASCTKLTGLDFLGTTIPMTKFSGIINLMDGYIFLDKMNALCWNGSLDAAIKFGIAGEKTTLDGQVIAKNIDLKKLAASYGADMDSALCEGAIRLQAPSLELKDLRAYGDLRIVNGNLMSLNIFQPIGAFVSDITGNIKELEESARQKKTEHVLTKLSKNTGKAISAIGSGINKTAQYVPGYNHIFAYDLQNAYVNYTIDKGFLKTKSFVADGYNLRVSGSLSIDLDKLNIHGNMWPEVSSLPTVLMSPITFLSDFMLDIVIYGNVDDLKWEFRLDRRLKGDDPVTLKGAGNKKQGSQKSNSSKKR